MSSDNPTDSDSDSSGAPQIENTRIENEMEQSYIDYAMSVIAGRALPDVRDGLKPVHRRILYAMNEAGVSSGSSHRKSSSIVGETMGDYHPHGDSAIYDTLARMAQDFSMRYPLVDGQGNFGSVDGDPPAAMRYTEARMDSIAEELLEDIDSDTVDFQANYDDRLEEPKVLPSAFPNLLVNGSSGIAVGMSTNIPPHNLGEVIDATIHLIDNPDCTIGELMQHIKGPDFPTGANIVGRSDVRQAFETGRGRVRVRAEFEVNEDAGRIVITELPFQQNKSRLVERIAEDVNDGSLEGIRDLRDESDRDGIRVVVELKRDARPEVVKNQLLETRLERTFGVINLALVEGEPRVLDLKETLVEYLTHRREVVRRRSEDELREKEDRAHILQGRLQALEHAETVVETIRDSQDRDSAIAALRSGFEFSQDQAEHIVRMQLGSLTSMEADEVQSEFEQVQARIERLEEILDSQAELDAVIVSELRDIRAEYADERRTSFIEDAGTVTHEDLIPEQQCVVVMSEDDYIKRMPLDTFSEQNRAGKGIIGADLKAGDSVASAFVAHSHHYLLAFTTDGQVYELKTYEIPEMSRTARGKSAVNLLDIDADETITAVVNCDKVGADVDEKRYLTMATQNGYVKRTAVQEFDNILSTGIRALRLENNDKLVDVEVTDGEYTIVVGSRDGMAIRFPEDQIRPMGRPARGVRGIDLQGSDRVAGLAAIDPETDDWTLTVTENGYGKRTLLGDYRVQSRNGKGLIDIETGSRNGSVTAVKTVGHDDHLLVMSQNGQIMRTEVKNISVVGRNTKGVKVMQLDEKDRIASVDVISADSMADESAADEITADEAESADTEEPQLVEQGDEIDGQ